MRRVTNFVIVIIVLVSLLFATSVNAAPREQVAAWQANTSYAVGALVTYGGQTYQCLQAHTSLTGWEPPNVPALWKLSSGVTNPPPTNTPVQPTNTPVPGTAIPTATPTTSGGSCASPAWSRTAVYVGGNTVSWVNREWRAKWWTQGEEPGTTGQWGVWEDKGACNGGVTPTNTPVTPTNTGVPVTVTPVTPTKTPSPTATQGGGNGGGILLGYFAQWDVYGRNFHIKNIATSGSASKLTHINYAFGNVSNGKCVIGDSYADYDRFYDADSSVDGVADSWDAGALRGNFNQIRKLKAMYPNIKVIWSFGGWTWSGGFGQAAANPTAFAQSCYDLVHDPRWDGVFDGIDIDWEYPNACGLTCDTSGPQAYVNLMSALRSKFGSQLVTAAIPAGAANINAANYGGAAQYVDWYNVMTYDFFGAFAPTGPTAPHSPLYSYAGIPTAGFYSDNAIQLLKSKGVPASKLLLGIGFYGRGWTGVSNVNGGLNQPATGAAQGTYEAGIEDYKVLVNTCPATGTIAGTAYAYCGGNWWSYDTPSTIAGKMTYVKNQGLGGAFFWEMSGDTSGGTLITAMYNNR